MIGVAGVVLFFAPAVGHDLWGWELTPFNTRFLGAIYLAALVAFTALVVVRRRTLARLVMPMDLLFMSVVLVVSLAYAERFMSQRPVTWVWFAIFVSVPVYAAWFVWRFHWFRGMAPPPPAPRARLGLVSASLPLAVYGAGLLAAPAAFTAFWPWPIDGFHGRVYSAIFLSLALGAAILSRGAALVDLTTLGLTCVALGALEPIGLVVVDADVDKVDWSSFGTWAWIAMFAALLAYGLALTGAGVRHHDPVLTTRPA